MTDLEKTKQFFDDLKIPNKISTRKGGYSDYKEDLIALSIEVSRRDDDIVNGYDGFVTTFLFTQENEQLYKMCIWE